jgi:hypothetical protein
MVILRIVAMVLRHGAPDFLQCCEITAGGSTNTRRHHDPVAVVSQPRDWQWRGAKYYVAHAALHFT